MSEEEAHSIIEAIDPNAMIEDTIEPEENIDDIIDENNLDDIDDVTESEDSSDSKTEKEEEIENIFDDVDDVSSDIDNETIDRDILAADVKKKFSDIKDKSLKDEVRTKVTEYGGLTKASVEQLQKLMEMMK